MCNGNGWIFKNVFNEHIQEEGAKSKDILIKDGFLPRVTTEDEKRRMTPAIIVTPVLITTPKPTLDEDSTVKLEINVITYSKDKMEGHRELFHILEKIRMAIFKNQTLGKKFRLSSEHDVKATIPYDLNPIRNGGHSYRSVLHNWQVNRRRFI